MIIHLSRWLLIIQHGQVCQPQDTAGIIMIQLPMEQSTTVTLLTLGNYALRVGMYPPMLNGLLLQLFWVAKLLPETNKKKPVHYTGKVLIPGLVMRVVLQPFRVDIVITVAPSAISEAKDIGGRAQKVLQ